MRNEIKFYVFEPSKTYIQNAKVGSVCAIKAKYDNGIWLKPHIVQLSNARFYDFIWGVPHILHERVVEAYQKENFVSDIKFDKIDEIHIKKNLLKGKIIPNYFSYDIPISKICIDYNKTLSDAIYEKECKGANAETKKIYVQTIKNGIYLNLENYNGEDIFCLREPCLIIFSKKFVDFIEKNQFTNFSYIPIEEYQMNDFSPMRKLSYGIK